jgi:hypothetical protein
MAKNTRRRMRAGGNFLKVGSTDSAGVDPDQQLTSTDAGHRDIFEAYIVYAAINGSLHDGRDNPFAYDVPKLRYRRHNYVLRLHRLAFRVNPRPLVN